MSSENTKLWDILGRTDPAATKGFTRGGGFKGTAIKPMWSFKRMTEEFGPCGIGWGVNEPAFQVVPGADGEVLVYCTASVWYAQGDTIARTVFGVGGDKVVGKNKHGLNSDDEAFKKAYTDAITNALKLIGVGADVHMGLFDDSKYVSGMREEFAEEQKPANRNGRSSSAQLKRDDVFPEMMREIGECGSLVSLQKLRGDWSLKAQKDGWPAQWCDAAVEEFDKAAKVIRDKVEDEPDEFPGDSPSIADNRYAQNYLAG